MDFIASTIREYAEMHTQPEPDLLKELSRFTYAKVLSPRMLSGHLQGRVLSMISKMIRPHYALELGTYTGYSAICIAEGIPAGGKLVTIEINEELKDVAGIFFRKSGYREAIEQHIGKAIEIIPQLHYSWDLVFIDADKANYSNYFDMVIDKVNSGGFIIADNVLWSGKVTDPKANDRQTQALAAFNKKVHNDPRVENFLLPIRDGLMVLRKV